MKIITLFTLLFFGFTYLNGTDHRIQTKNAEKERAAELIIKLKSGALLVQLKSKQETIDAYLKKGYQSIAEEIAQKQHLDNIKIMKAFKESFRFCEVYFFRSNQIDAIKEKRLDDVVFVNKDNEPDPDIKLNSSFYMIASYSNADDTSEKQYKSLLSFSTLTIKDDAYHAMAKPFPFYLKMPEELPKFKKLKKKIYNYDKELRFFYYRQPAQNK